MKNINYRLEQKVLPRKLREECFECMAEEDFNPDIVDCYGLDMFEAGCNTGMLIGMLLAFTMAGLGIGIKTLVNWIKSKKSADHQTKEES